MAHKEEYLIKNISIKIINETIKKYILDYKKIFIRFKFDCRIDSVIEKFNKNNKVNLYIMFYSEKEDATYKHYLRCPKPMIENQMPKILAKNPILIKSLGRYLGPIPLIRYFINKYWVRIVTIKNNKKLVHDYNW